MINFNYIKITLNVNSLIVKQKKLSNYIKCQDSTIYQLKETF